jgi:hypothetical protein
VWPDSLHRTASHIFGGTANRRLSEEDGLVVDLCHSCHNEPPNGVHFNKDNMHRLHVHGQRVWEMGKIVNDGMTDEQAREAFIKRYGRNYL